MRWGCRWMLSLTISTSALTHGFIAGHPLGRRAQGGGSDTTQRKGLSWVVYGKIHPDFKALFLRKLPPWCAGTTTQPCTSLLDGTKVQLPLQAKMQRTHCIWL